MDLTAFKTQMLDKNIDGDDLFIENSIQALLKNNSDADVLITIIEELAELQQALTKSSRYKNASPEIVTNCRWAVIEEMADVYTGLKLLQELYHISDSTLEKAVTIKFLKNEKNSFSLTKKPPTTA